MAHTPGPWEVAIPGEVDEHYAVLDGFGHTASVYGHPEETSAALANARLIAAAPDLLAALRAVNAELIELYERAYPDDETDNDTTAAIDMAIAAIAKAEGK